MMLSIQYGIIRTPVSLLDSLSVLFPTMLCLFFVLLVLFVSFKQELKLHNTCLRYFWIDAQSIYNYGCHSLFSRTVLEEFDCIVRWSESLVANFCVKTLFSLTGDTG